MPKTGRRRAKKRKQSFIPYSYDRVYTKSIENIAEQQMLEMLREGRGSVYGTKEIRSGDQLEVEIYPQFTRKQADLIPDEGKREKQRQRQRALDDKKSKKMCERIINANFVNNDLWITLTYSEENVPKSMEEANRNMTGYIRRINYRRKKAGLPNARYVYVTECSRSGRWHHHMVMDGDIAMDEVEKLWKLGKRNEVRRLERDKHGLTGLARYITKTPAEKNGKGNGKGQKTWRTSKGLKKPEEKVTHYKVKSKDVDRIVRDREEAQRLMEKLFASQGYTFDECEVKYNDFNRRFYVYARMHKEGEDIDRNKDTGSGRRRAEKKGQGRANGAEGKKRKKDPGSRRQDRQQHENRRTGDQCIPAVRSHVLDDEKHIKGEEEKDT